MKQTKQVEQAKWEYPFFLSIRIQNGIRQFHYSRRKLDEADIKSLPDYAWVDEQLGYELGDWLIVYREQKQLAQALQQEVVERIIKIADDLWKSPPWSPEWNDENYKVEGYRRAMRDIQEALQQEQE